MSTETSKPIVKVIKFNPANYPNMAYEMRLVVRDFVAMVKDTSRPYNQRVYFNSMLELILSGAMDYETAIIESQHQGYSSGLNASYGGMEDFNNE